MSTLACNPEALLPQALQLVFPLFTAPACLLARMLG